MFLISSEAIIESDVKDSNNKDKNGNYMIDTINSKSIIYGNVYSLADSFTLQAGSEIHGDLYVLATRVNIEPNAVIQGNVFICASEVNLNGQIKGSAYITTQNININYYSYIERDLYLNSKSSATLDGVVYRNAFITVNDTLTTKSDFKVNGNLSVNSAKDFTFSGKVSGDATINVANLSFKSDEENPCSIRGNLQYATKNNSDVPSGIVSGNITTTEYVVNNEEDKISFASLIFSFITLLIYVFAVVFLAKTFASKSLEKLPDFKAKNVLISFTLGFVSMFMIFAVFILLCMFGVGILAAFFLVSAYLFVMALALPLFLNKIANVIKLKMNGYLKLLIVTAVYYLVTLIPASIGPTVTLIIIQIGIGQILLGLFKRNK